MSLLTVNGAELYHEVRGKGPPVLMIMGATGDAGHLQALAEALSDEFTVVTYDRRANGRSPRPSGWSTTTVEEQADDAAGLVGALGLVPAAIFGTSIGAIYALDMVIRHPGAVGAAVLHEPPLYSVLDRPQDALAEIAPALREAMLAGGAQAAIERFWRWVSGDAGWERLAPDLRERILSRAGIFFDIERGTFESYRPDDETLASLTTPIHVLAGEESPPFRRAIARWLAERLGVAVSPAPGAHTPYVDRPHELARVIRPFLRRVGEPLRDTPAGA